MHPIQRCLNPKLIAICKKSIQIEGLNDKVNGYLPAELKTHCTVASFTQGCLSLIVDDPVWASSLRFMLPEMRDKLRAHAGMYQLISIKITVKTYSSSNINPKAKTGRGLSDQARNIITHSSEQCSYEPLKKALQALGQAEKIMEHN